MSAVELKPCPTPDCGGRVEVMTFPDPKYSDRKLYHVGCSCGWRAPFSDDIVRAHNAWNARADLPPAAVTVKPLKWECEAGWRWKGTPPDGFFKSVAKWVSEKADGSGWVHAGDKTLYSTAEKAKAAAQADYERRILSVLTPAPVVGNTDPMTIAKYDDDPRKVQGGWRDIMTPDELREASDWVIAETNYGRPTELHDQLNRLADALEAPPTDQSNAGNPVAEIDDARIAEVTERVLHDMDETQPAMSKLHHRQFLKAALRSLAQEGE